MHRLTARILYDSNAFENMSDPIHEIIYVIPPPYYIDWFEIYYPNFIPNQDDFSFCIQFMNKIQEKKPAGLQWNRVLDAVVKMFK